MKKHNGMRPHDLAVLLLIASKGKEPWLMKDLAYELEISNSEISESLNRSSIAGLLNSEKQLNKLALLDFLRAGLPYVFPLQPGPIVRGISTAYSAPPLNEQIISEEKLVWPYGEGSERGQAIEPLYPNAPKACLKNELLYELMSLTDALRVGRAREKNLAFDMLKERILNA